MAMRLIGKLTHFDVDLLAISALIEKDVLLCGQLLRAVNSARFARRNTINRARDAVVMLGIGKLRKLALSLTVTNLFGRSKTAPGWSPLRFNLHSAAVGMMADGLARHTKAENLEIAFVGGLLHDIGKFAIALNLHREFEMIRQLRSSSGRDVAECEREVLGFDHAELSGMILARWELPIQLQHAVFYHHAPEASQPNDPPKLSAVLSTADQFVNYLTISVEPVDTETILSCSLEIPGAKVPTETILSEFKQEYAELAELFH